MVHIAWLGKKSPFCGNVTYGNSTTKELRARGHKISFIHFDNPSSLNSSKPLFLANDPDVSLPYLIKSQVYTIPSPRAEKELRLSLVRLKPDIVHASTQQLTYQLYAPSLAKFDKIIIFSEPQKNVLEKLGVPKEKQIIIPNGVDENIWEPFCKKSKKYDQVKNKLGNERIFLYMGRIANEKNIEALLRSWRQTKTQNCKLVIVGDGPMKPTLENSFSNLGNEKLIWWGAELDLETRIAIMQIAEVFLLPSLVEGLSLSLLEAMSAGTACVATDAGADGEVLDNGAGIVISTENVAAQLKTIIPILIEHPSFTKDLGEKARKRILERYTITKNINSLEKVYMNLKDN